MTVVKKGRELWTSAELGTNGVACAQCHPNAANTHPETYPKFQKQLGRVIALRDMINWFQVWISSARSQVVNGSNERRGGGPGGTRRPGRGRPCSSATACDHARALVVGAAVEPTVSGGSRAHDPGAEAAWIGGKAGSGGELVPHVDRLVPPRVAVRARDRAAAVVHVEDLVAQGAQRGGGGAVILHAPARLGEHDAEPAGHGEGARALSRSSASQGSSFEKASSAVTPPVGASTRTSTPPIRRSVTASVAAGARWNITV